MGPLMISINRVNAQDDKLSHSYNHYPIAITLVAYSLRHDHNRANSLFADPNRQTWLPIYKRACVSPLPQLNSMV